MFKINNKNTQSLFLCSVYIIELKQVNVSWVWLLQENQSNLINMSLFFFICCCYYYYINQYSKVMTYLIMAQRCTSNKILISLMMILCMFYFAPKHVTIENKVMLGTGKVCACVKTGNRNLRTTSLSELLFKFE